MWYFVAIAEERSFTRAAKRCHVALSSLSKQIRDLEVRLEEKLLERLPRDIRLTDAGRIFQKEARKALEHSLRAASLVRSLRRQKEQTLKIGLSALCDLPRVAQCRVSYRRSSGLPKAVRIEIAPSQISARAGLSFGKG
jgi:DNA-binding transcriptional LysR family regulator